ncbi:unnamed protein product [Cuscuta campestris]|uniref:Phytocyanin domain-containing protein n=1 Tax=Cuscuta campestris TaxID=132261 RepID=A0A484KB14_9ASTE|nr:unnamed protein product [Cuscuta campestris]
MGSMVAALLAVAAIMGGGRWWSGVAAEEHRHVVGGDRGWEVSNDIASWSSGRTFTVGDSLWITYSAAQENVVELGSREEYISCDLSNPIKMYTDGLDQIPLEGEGTRYFASGNPESCKNGLKFPVIVLPQTTTYTHKRDPPLVLRADGPTAPSSSTRLNGHVPCLFTTLLALVMFF